MILDRVCLTTLLFLMSLSVAQANCGPVAPEEDQVVIVRSVCDVIPAEPDEPAYLCKLDVVFEGIPYKITKAFFMPLYEGDYLLLAD